jgi:hypothetical protein
MRISDANVHPDGGSRKCRCGSMDDRQTQHDDASYTRRALAVEREDRSSFLIGLLSKFLRGP